MDDLLEDLVSYGAVVAYGQDSMSVRLAIEKVRQSRSWSRALRPVRRALALRRLRSSPPERIEIEAMEEPLPQPPLGEQDLPGEPTRLGRTPLDESALSARPTR